MTHAIKHNRGATFTKRKLARCFGSSLMFMAAASTSFVVQANERFLEEIIVTAQKRQQNLQDVPMTVTALSEDALQNNRINSIEDLKSIAPALNILTTVSPAHSAIQVRGAGTGASDPTLEPSVGVYIDGVFMPRSIFGLSDIVDISQVEILLGPQGTLYGKNTNSGVISVRPKNPRANWK